VRLYGRKLTSHTAPAEPSSQSVHTRMRTILKREGVTMRNRKAATDTETSLWTICILMTPGSTN
jgi:hypothetical protein